MPAVRLFHRRELLCAGGALMGSLPGLVGHAIDNLATLVPAHLHPPCVGGFLEPVGQAVAAETREIHQLDILHIVARAEMFDQAPEGGGFEFRSGSVIDRHGRSLSVCLCLRIY